jgi:hypothetical protein
MTPATARQAAISAKTRHGRAVNAVAEHFRRTLSVPNIYFEPKPATLPFDLLAVDRAGSGDLHGVEVKILANVASLIDLKLHLSQVIKLFADWPAHYRYLALPKTPQVIALLPKLNLFSSDGFGRIGILLISEPESGLPHVELDTQPERYRVPALAMEKVDKFLASTRPDIETRI